MDINDDDDERSEEEETSNNDNDNNFDDDDDDLVVVGSGYYVGLLLNCALIGCGDFEFDKLGVDRDKSIDKRSDLEAESGSNGKRRRRGF